MRSALLHQRIQAGAGPRLQAAETWKRQDVDQRIDEMLKPKHIVLPGVDRPEELENTGQPVFGRSRRRSAAIALRSGFATRWAVNRCWGAGHGINSWRF